MNSGIKSNDGDKQDCRGETDSTGTAQVPQSIFMEQLVVGISGMGCAIAEAVCTARKTTTSNQAISANLRFSDNSLIIYPYWL